MTESGEPERLAAELMHAASSGELEPALERLVALPRAESMATVLALGRQRQPEAALLLSAVAARPDLPKELRKEARRGLHRIRGLGLEVTLPTPAPATPSRPVERLPELVRAWTTAPDGVGSRPLWLLFLRPLGGAYGAAMLLNEIAGLKACSVDETTRRRFEQLAGERQAQSGLEWVELPARYARQLLGEALALNQASGFPIPREYLTYQRALGEPALPFEGAIVYEQLRADEVAADPTLLADSPSLLEHEDFRGWFFGFDDVKSFALELMQARESRIILSPESKTEREERILQGAIQTVVTEPVRHGLKRRLEETAYVLQKLGRQRDARLALAAALRLEPGTLPGNPLLRAMMLKSLELAGEVERAKVPVELVRRSPMDPID